MPLSFSISDMGTAPIGRRPRLGYAASSARRNGAREAKLLLAVAAIEALDAASRVHETLLSGVKRMAIRAELDLNGAQSGMRFESVAASAGDHATAIDGMDCSFHLNA
jgi:hypothetical protein